MQIALAPGLFFPNYYGGLEFYTLHVAHLLQRKGHDVFILCVEPILEETKEIVAVDETYEGLPLRRLIYNPTLRPPEKCWSQVDEGLAARFCEALVSWKAEALHITGAISMAIVSQAHELNLPVVYTATDFSMTCSRGGRLIRSDGSLCDGKEGISPCLQCQRHRSAKADMLYGLIRWLPEPLLARLSHLTAYSPRPLGILEIARSLQYRIEVLRPIVNTIDQIIAPSNWMKQILVLNGIDKERIVVSEYGIYLDSLSALAKRPADTVRFAFFGRMDPLKGIHHLIKAFNSLDRSQGATLTIYGAATPASKDYAKTVRQLAGEDGQIQFAGLIDNKDVGRALETIDVVVVPSLWYENSPLIVLESLASGTPVIASDVGGISDLIHHGENGLLCAPGNEDSLSMALQMCIDNPELIQKMANNIRPVKSIEQDVDWLVSLYIDLLERYSKYG